MSTTIKDILELDILKDATMLAGTNGLNKNIRRVSFTDCPIRIEGMDERVIMSGDFFIGSLYIYKDNYEGLFENIKFYIEYGAVGLCIVNEYFDNLPDEILNYAEENDFVIFIVDKETPYADLIHDIMELIMINQENIILEMKIDYLLNRNVSRDDIINTAKLIINDIGNCYASIYFKNSDINYRKINFFRQMVNASNGRNFIKYRKGFIAIIDFEKKEYVQTEIDYTLKQIRFWGNDYKIGVSSIFNNIESFAQCLRQAITAYNFTDIKNDRIVYYDNLGLYKILYFFKDSAEFNQMYKEIIKPLKDYDDYNNANLLGTVIKFVEMDGDYKLTAEKLFQHENTIRYRIGMVKKILNLEDKKLKFYEQISLVEKVALISKYLK